MMSDTFSDSDTDGTVKTTKDVFAYLTVVCTFPNGVEPVPLVYLRRLARNTDGLQIVQTEE